MPTAGGANFEGQVGDGTKTGRLRPVAVLGGFLFGQIEAGGQHTCGVTTVDRAYCWGNNFYGQLGDGTTTKRRLRPVAVSGQRRFDNVNAGYFHTCGVTLAGRGFCWGLNSSGDLGNGTPVGNLTTPTAVLGGLTWRAMSGGISHTCGVTTDDRAYCWGDNTVGQLGDGTAPISHSTPVAVVGPM